MKQIKKSAFIIIVSFVLTFLFNIGSQAAISEEDKEIVKINIVENFDKELYKPGDSDYLKFTFENVIDQKVKIKRIYLSYKEDSLEEKFEELAKHTYSTIKYGDKVIEKTSLNKLLKNTEGVKVDIEIDPHKTEKFEFKIEIDSSLGNEVQNIYQELFINTEYQVCNTGGLIPNSIDKHIGTTDVPTTGDLSNNSQMIFLAITGVLSAGIIMIVLYRKKLNGSIE